MTELAQLDAEREQLMLDIELSVKQIEHLDKRLHEAISQNRAMQKRLIVLCAQMHKLEREEAGQ